MLENTGGGGGSSLNVIELTQAEYDALSEKQTDTIYVITDAVELKFKTINGQEITGEGDIEIQGGGGSINIIELTQAEYDALTSYDDDTFYVITDADKQYVIQSDLSNYYTKSEIDSLIGNVSSKITEINNLI